MPTEDILQSHSASIKRLFSFSLAQTPLLFKTKFGLRRQMHKTLTLKDTVLVEGGDWARLGSADPRMFASLVSILAQIPDWDLPDFSAAVGWRNRSGEEKGGGESVSKLFCGPDDKIPFTTAQVAMSLPWWTLRAASVTSPRPLSGMLLVLWLEHSSLPC